MASVKTRIKQKNDSTANWNTANTEGFKPLQGEIIVYNDVNRIKIGDGSNTVSNVPFLDANCVHLTGTETIDGLKKFTTGPMIVNSITNAYTSLKLFEDGTKAGIGWNDGQGNDGYVFIPRGQSDTLAMCYEIPDKHFTSFGVGDDLSGQTLYFNTSIVYTDNYFQAVKTIAESSGGYTIAVGGPPNITLSKNETIITTFYDFGSNKWLKSSYTLPSDFGTVTTFNDAHGLAKDSIFYTLGLAPIYEYTKLDVEDVYKKIPAVIDSTNSTSSTNALSAFQGNQLKILVDGKAPNNHASTATTYGVGTSANYGHVKVISGDLNGKTAQDGCAASQSHIHSQYAPKESPTFTGTVTLSGNTTPLNVGSSVGAAGQVLTSQGVGKSPTWKTVPIPTNYVTTDTAQTITGNKSFTGTFAVDGSNASFANTASSADGIIIDCYENEGTGDSIFRIDAVGENKGKVFFGDGAVDVNINLGTSTYISSNVILGANLTSYPRSTFSVAGMTILPSSTAGTNYGATSISRQSGNNGYTIYLPSGGGTLALTSQIPSTSNFVTTTTTQSISGTKTFSSGTIHTGGITSKRAAGGYLLDCHSSASGAVSSTVFGAYLSTAGGSSTHPVGKVVFGQGNTECAIELSGTVGGVGNSLISQGPSKTPKWVDVTSADNISTVKYSVGTSSNVTFNNGDYGTYTSQTFNGYKFLTTTSSNGTQRYTHVYTAEFTKSVSAGRWVHFDGWRSGETILSVIVTPSKNTTSGYGPRMISWFTGSDVYVAADDDNAPNGFSITVTTRDN